MGRTRRWRRLDVPGTEDFIEEGPEFHGRVRVEESVPWSAEYRVTFAPDWVTRLAEVSVQHPVGPRSLELRRNDSGQWFADDREIESCRGAVDVDLGVTPSTNTSAIRRLQLLVGRTAELTATWVRFPELTVEPLRQRYTRLSGRSYRYESLRENAVVFQAVLEVDATGLVERYERFFERVDAPPPG
jgi:hypothetical protein